MSCDRSRGKWVKVLNKIVSFKAAQGTEKKKSPIGKCRKCVIEIKPVSLIFKNR
jgi:hypothetical protein